MITPLPFDSDLFGYPVGKCQIGETWSEARFMDKVKDYQLVYIFSESPLAVTSPHLRRADIKLTFQKDLTQVNSPDSDIHPYSGDLTDTLLDLALESGICSRFKTDPGFRNGEYKKLYSLWIKNAINQHEVWVADRMTGFVSCHLSGEKAQIGLIAIDKSRRGEGWGRKLVLAAENFALNKEAKSMTIGTQEANIPAASLYRSLNYRLVERVFVYHYWQG